MAYEIIDPVTGQTIKKYTLKEKYEYYKNKANSRNSKNSQGQTIGFTGRVELANKANRIKRKMGANKRKYEYYNK